MFELRFLFTDLFVSAQGKLSRGRYVWGIVRLWLAFSIGSNFLSGMILGWYPSLRTAENFSSQPALAIARFVALCIIAWPLWSQFRRRVNDMGPDIQRAIRQWGFILALLLAAFIVGLVLHSFAIDLPFSKFATEILGGLFSAALFALSFAPSENLNANPPLLQSTNMMEPSSRSVARSGTSGPTTAQNPLPPMQRLHKLPKDGRVKPGWFS